MTITPGTLLIAPPSVKHHLWEHSTVLITDIERTGGITGVILNKCSQMTIAEFGSRLNADLEHVPGLLHIGGPDRQTSFTLLHSNDWKSKNTFQINEYFSISSDDDILSRFEVGDEPDQWRMFLGMCTWQPGDLESQMNGSKTSTSSISWCRSSCDPDLAFDTDLDDVWDIALERCSLEFAQNFML
jgi:putative transcriptional regulator